MKKSQKQALAIGAGVAALAATAAGVYFLTGKNAKNRKKAAKWVSGLQKDVVKQLRTAKNVSQSVYNKAVDEAAANYQGLKNISALELAATVNELKNHWKGIRRELEGAAKSVKHIRPKPRKSTSRRVAVKSTKKSRR